MPVTGVVTPPARLTRASPVISPIRPHASWAAMPGGSSWAGGEFELPTGGFGMTIAGSSIVAAVSGAPGTTAPAKAGQGLGLAGARSAPTGRSRSAHARASSGRVLQDRFHGLPGPAKLDAHHDLRDAVEEAEQAEQQRQGDRTDAGAGEEHDTERD
jgi:hypothetical protein